MRRRLPLSLALLLAAAGAASPLGAQIIRVSRTSSPVGWISGSAGIFQPRSIPDGTTSAVWDFGNALQWRGSVEMALQNHGSVGVTATYADTPLRYYDYSGRFVSCNVATNGCDAHAKVWTAMASFHMGGGAGFHQVIEISAGVLGYQDFTADDGGARLGPSSVDLDFALGLGYGFGYGITPRLQIALVQDYTAALHQKENLEGNTDTFSQHGATRLTVRYGLGTRSRL